MITFNDLVTAGALPSGSVAEVSGEVTINVNTLVQDAAIDMNSDVSEFAHKLLEAAEKAQVVYNSGNGSNPDLNAFPAFTAAAPVIANGQLVSTLTHTVRVRAPLGVDSIVSSTV